MRAEVNDILHHGDSLFALPGTTENKSKATQGGVEAPEPQPEEGDHPKPDLSAASEQQVKAEPQAEHDDAGAPNELAKASGSRPASKNAEAKSSPVKVGSSQEAELDDALQQHIRAASEMSDTKVSHGINHGEGVKQSPEDEIAKFEAYFD